MTHPNPINNPINSCYVISNPISSPYAVFKPMKQPKTLREIKAEKRAIIENAWFNQEISDDQLEAEYKALGIKKSD